MPILQTRRRFVTTAAVAAAGLVRAPPALAAEGVLETMSVRLPKVVGVCVSPQHIAEELLRAEGFSDIRYVETPAAATPEAIGRGELDFGLNYAPLLIPAIDAAAPVVVLAGVHPGCFELFAKEGIRTVADLKGKSVGVQDWGLPHVLVSLMAAHVGLDPAKHIRWVTDPSVKPIEQFVDGKIDAVLGFPPQPQDLRARHIGHVIVNSTVDRPWSQYFCCMVGANREYVQNHQARDAPPSQGDGSMCHRPDARRATDRRGRFHPAIRLRSPDFQRGSVRQMARL
jgi:NitT/TauT family transport system substrate-binding protein